MATKREVIENYAEQTMELVERAESIMEAEMQVSSDPAAELAKNSNLLLLVLATTSLVILKSLAVEDWDAEEEVI